MSAHDHKAAVKPNSSVHVRGTCRIVGRVAQLVERVISKALGLLLVPGTASIFDKVFGSIPNSSSV